MKLLFSFLSFLLITACNQGTANSKINKSSYLDLKISDTPDIFGSWTMCTSLANGTVIQMNVCPRIIFKSNGIGQVEKYESGNNPFPSTEIFIWNLEKGHLKVFSQGKNSIFPDTNYYAKFDKQKTRIELTISHNDDSYYLSKGVTD